MGGIDVTDPAQQVEPLVRRSLCPTSSVSQTTGEFSEIGYLNGGRLGQVSQLQHCNKITGVGCGSVIAKVRESANVVCVFFRFA